MAGRAERCCRFTIETEVFAYLAYFAVSIGVNWWNPCPFVVNFGSGVWRLEDGESEHRTLNIESKGAGAHGRACDR